MINPAIIVVAFNRPKSLKRILTSLEKAVYPGKNVPLVISIDYSGKSDVLDIAKNFNWAFGEKRIIAHKQNIGLRKHIISSGDLTSEYENVIVLEDDLILSPYFYCYALQALKKYSNNTEIAGIGLYSYRYNQTSHLPFNLIEDGYDSYFMKVPCSWGQLWTNNQWQSFKNWYLTAQQVTSNDYLPREVVSWPESSWKKYYWKYLVEENKYFVYPVKAYSTNTGDIGNHHNRYFGVHHVDISLKRNNFNFPDINETINVYDQFFELLSEKINIPGLKSNSVEIDINGAKPNELINKEYCISIKKCKKIIDKFPAHYFPLQFNLSHPLKNTDSHVFFNFGKTNDFESEIDETLIDFIASRIPIKVFEYIKTVGRKEVYSSKAYIIGHRFIRIKNFIPNLIKKIF